MKHIFILVLTSILATFLACSTMVTISSEPSGANVFLNGKLSGKTPYKTKLSDFVGKSYPIRLQLKGYHDIRTQLGKEAKVGTIVGGIFIWPLFLWCYGPEANQHYILQRKGQSSIFLNNSKNITVLIDNKKIKKGKNILSSGYHSFSFIKNSKIYKYKSVLLSANMVYEIRYK